MQYVLVVVLVVTVLTVTVLYKKANNPITTAVQTAQSRAATAAGNSAYEHANPAAPGDSFADDTGTTDDSLASDDDTIVSSPSSSP